MRYLTLLILLLSFVVADCGSGQVDINSASLDELDTLSGIGPAYAGRIIEGRPFSSVDELTGVKGIGPVTLDKIKTQGLACVDGEEVKTTVSTDNEEEESVATSVDSEVDEEVGESSVEDKGKDTEKTITLASKSNEVISLGGGVIEVDNEPVYVSKNGKISDYLIYGFSIFLVLVIGILVAERF